jgi:hypothetical protein
MIEPELEERYNKSLVLLRRIMNAEDTLRWKEVETYEDIIPDIRDFLSDTRNLNDVYIIPTESQIIIFDSEI